jgi:hypothetical protein
MKTLDDYKTEMIGHTYGWLTILDVFRDEHGNRVCKCQCKCGNITVKDLKRVYGGKTTSCGCYNSSKEKAYRFRELCKNNPDISKKISEKVRNWISQNPDKLKERGKKYSEWCKNHKDELLEKGNRYSEWCKNNPDKVKSKTEKRKKTLEDNPEILINQGVQHHNFYIEHPYIGKIAGKKLSDYIKNNYDKKLQQSKLQSESLIKSNIIKRSNDVSSIDLSFIHEDDLDNVVSGNTLSVEKVRTRCPACGNYEFHRIGNIIDYSINKIKSIPLCFKCLRSLVTSKYEDEIANYISTFYNGECIRNSREIISPYELDLYYPDISIAVEFNGDYWHSNIFKDKDYHYNKFKKCRDIGITLISIFESQWNSINSLIKDYIRDLFNNKNNNLSFLKEGYMNNNYPALNISIDENESYVELNYLYNNITVNTCGYSKILNS